MKNPQNSKNTEELKSSKHVSQWDEPKKQEPEAPVEDSGSISISSSDNRKITRKDIELVQNLIERCLQLYMNRGEVVKTLLNRAKIQPGFTTLVWQKLEEENSEFFRAYYIRLKLKKQIILFNHFLENQYHLMKYPMPPKLPISPMPNGIRPTMPVNNLPMGYPVMQQPQMPVPVQPHFDNMNCGLSSCHVVNGVPAPSNYHHPIRANTRNDTVMDGTTSKTTPPLASCRTMSSVSELERSPASASSGHFPFAHSEISGMEMDTSMIDTAFTSDVGMDGVGSSKDSLRSLGQIPWNFSLSDLTTDLTNLDELGALGNYSGSPFLHSDSDILQDDMVDNYFADDVTGSGSDEGKS